MIIRRGKIGEINKIITCANEAFIPVRYPEFDFRVNMEKIYNSSIDYSPSHVVIEENDQFISIGGNLLKEITLDKSTFLTSFVGTISVLPQYQKKGLMKKLMLEIEKENIDKSVDFSILTGDRTRYNHYNYEKIGFDYYLHIAEKRLNKERLFNVDELINCHPLFLKTYELYLDLDILKLKTQGDFLASLHTGKRKAFLVYDNDDVKGYFTIKNNYSIDEFKVFDLMKVDTIIYSIFSYFKKNLPILVSSLDKALFEKVSSLSEIITVSDEIMVKAYHLDKFLEFALKLNQKKLSREYLYQVEGKKYLIKNEHVTIVNDGRPEKTFINKESFLRYVFSFESLYDNGLTLFFSIDNSDLF